VIGRITIPNVFEFEASIETDKPSSQTKEEFGKGWMYIEVILAINVVRRELAEMNLIKTSMK